MINFWIGPLGKKEISFGFDYSDAEDLLEIIKKVKKESGGAVIEVAKIVNGSTLVENLGIHSVPDEKDERACVAKSAISIFLTEDSLDYAIFKIEKFIAEGDFSPAEFGSFKSGKGFDFQIYFIKKMSMGFS